MCVYINWQHICKFHGNILNLSENIAKSFRGATFLFTCYSIHPNRNSVLASSYDEGYGHENASVHGTAACNVTRLES